MDMIASPSPNFNDRKLPDGQTGPNMLVLHYTDLETSFEALSILQSPEREVSAHYLVDEDGTIYKLVDEDKRAWHAGVSYWDGHTDLNSMSIGIELQNPGHSNGYREFPEAQMKAVKELCQDIMSRHDIPDYYVLGHSDIAPGRKTDPGELFDWKFLAENGIGLWPNVTEDDASRAKDIEKDPKQLTEEFQKYGYNPDTSAEDAFQQHFRRENTAHTDVELLCSLNRQKKASLPKPK